MKRTPQRECNLRNTRSKAIYRRSAVGDSGPPSKSLYADSSSSSSSTSQSGSGHDEDDTSKRRLTLDSKSKAKASKADGQADVHSGTSSVGTQTEVEAQINKDDASGTAEAQSCLTVDDIRKAFRSTTVELKPQVIYLIPGKNLTRPAPSVAQLQEKPVDGISPAIDSVSYKGNVLESLLHSVENGTLPPTVESLKAIAKLQIVFLEKLRASGSASERVMEMSSLLARVSEMIANLD